MCDPFGLLIYTFILFGLYVSVFVRNLFLLSLFLFLTVFYVCICTDVKLTWWSVFRVFLFAACLLPAIYSLNMYLVGYYSDVNYWYLMITPAANTLLDFFPAPPWHIPYLALITVILFTAIYLPFKYLNSYKQTSF